MGVGPAVAIPAAVKSAGLELDDIDLFEINEVSIEFGISEANYGVFWIYLCYASFTIDVNQ